ncbi:hypothetical protein L596_011519 [Steinernema carpocapsae]|uniref:Uncharacterized protein n=1 Tax=Steinernema carpocapsae TaxID=34508 RepID=A0A4U5NUK3_STECR|nr:hypothetical protein L596_011519 [Steinernema carpocapsae]
MDNAPPLLQDKDRVGDHVMQSTLLATHDDKKGGKNGESSFAVFSGPNGVFKVQFATKNSCAIFEGNVKTRNSGGDKGD